MECLDGIRSTPMSERYTPNLPVIHCRSDSPRRLLPRAKESDHQWTGQSVQQRSPAAAVVVEAGAANPAASHLSHLQAPGPRHHSHQMTHQVIGRGLLLLIVLS
jgi:hypothetical protein